MKYLLLAALVGCCMVAAKHDYADILREIESSHRFQRLSFDQQLMYGELIVAAESGPAHLKAFLHRHGKLLEFLHMEDKLSKDDRSHLDKYIAARLNPQAPVKRQATTTDLNMWLEEIHILTKVSKHLNDVDKKMFLDLMYAVEHNQLTQYVANVHYGAIIKLMSHIDAKRTHEFYNMIIAHLETEAANSGPHTSV